jgi:hypothetical protein
MFRKPSLNKNTFFFTLIRECYCFDQEFVVVTKLLVDVAEILQS